MSDEVDEKLERWVPIDGIDDAFLTAELWYEHPTLAVRLIDGGTQKTTQRDLILLFERVAAVRVHEEYVHPTQGSTCGVGPRISDSNDDTFPCLTVDPSPLLEELRDELAFFYHGAKHYRLCTCYPVIDVVTAEQPYVYWPSIALVARRARGQTSKSGGGVGRRGAKALSASPECWARLFLHPFGVCS